MTDFPFSTVAVAAAVAAAVAGIIQLKRYYGSRICYSKMKLDGQTVVITGANTGIGKATATELARRNARVIMACRDKERGLKACSEIKQLSGSDKVVVRQLDLASLESIRKFASHVLEEEHHIDILINNAGVMAYSFWRTADGFEMQLGVNHLGHFLLTNLLLNQIKESVPSRIINVSSRLYKRGQINFGDLHNKERYSGVRAYSQSKLANILFTRQLAERLEGTGVTVYSVSPGFVRTELGRHFLRASILYKLLYVILYPIYWLVSKSPEQGAETIIYCAVAEELEGVSGKFYFDCAEKRLAEHAMDDGVAKKLWEVSEELTGWSVTQH